MYPIEKNLGKIGITINGDYDKTLAYQKLCMVKDVSTGITYISRKDVPVGIAITDTNYWQSFSVNGNVAVPITIEELLELLN